MPLLSVIIPVYNESKTIKRILEKINSESTDKEIIVVDDSSTDDTARILREVKYNNLKVIHHTSNRGKGAAFLTGLSQVEGEFVIIQDADLEYDPNDYCRLLEEIKATNADIIFGKRFQKGYKGLFMHRLGNKTLTALLNLLFKSHIADYATCFKLARKNTFIELNLSAKGFDIDVEIVCRALKQNKRICEIPVSYNPRTYKEGKKIRWRDGLWAMFYMFKYRFQK